MLRDERIDESFRTAARWRREADALREILLDCDLTEELKWGKPCYTHCGSNICIIQRMNDFLALMFFKGALLKNADGVLEVQGPNSKAGYRIRFTSVQDVVRLNAATSCISQPPGRPPRARPASRGTGNRYSKVKGCMIDSFHCLLGTIRAPFGRRAAE